MKNIPILTDTVGYIYGSKDKESIKILKPFSVLCRNTICFLLFAARNTAIMVSIFIDTPIYSIESFIPNVPTRNG